MATKPKKTIKRIGVLPHPDPEPTFRHAMGMLGTARMQLNNNIHLTPSQKESLSILLNSAMAIYQAQALTLGIKRSVANAHTSSLKPENMPGVWVTVKQSITTIETHQQTKLTDFLPATKRVKTQPQQE
jgi:hypothetical protein